MTTRLLVSLTVLLSAFAASAAEEPRPLRVLLTNDDGFDAPGLVALSEELAGLGQLVVAAPYDQQSGSGHGITTTRLPVLVRRYQERDGIPWYALEARPATCVRVALEAILEDPPDVVVSGINAGANLGLVSFYSGTVGAAREAAIAGYPAVAVSLDGNSRSDFRAGAAVIRELIESLRERDLLRPGLLLNVNIPRGIAQRGAEVRITRQSLQRTDLFYERRESPHRFPYFWGNYREFEIDEEPSDTDVRAVLEGSVSVTPLQLDQTAEDRLRAMRRVEGSLNEESAATRR